MNESAILEIFEIDYSDLVLIASANYESLCSEEIHRLQLIAEYLMENLGPTGPGLVAVKSVPEASILRRRLLPLARKLAILHNDDRKRILKEHNLGSDVSLKNLDRVVSSFVMQLNYENLGLEKNERHEISSVDGLEFENFGGDFKKLGFLMMKIGVYLAQICDRVIGSRELEPSLLESCSAKGRLIHYHSGLDNLIIKEAAKSNGRHNCKSLTRDVVKLKSFECCGQTRENKDIAESSTGFWQQWHYDYGIFTVLTSPLFLQSDEQRPCPNGSTYLQIFHPEKKSVFSVAASPECFIVQVGESADLLSKGMLRATLHCVSRPLEHDDLSRETFAVFLQPAWNKTFSLADYNPHPSNSGSWQLRLPSVGSRDTKLRLENSLGDIHRVVPPLTMRMKDGMTFDEFSRETTKQYYGSSGLQSKP